MGRSPLEKQILSFPSCCDIQTGGAPHKKNRTFSHFVVTSGAGGCGSLRNSTANLHKSRQHNLFLQLFTIFMQGSHTAAAHGAHPARFLWQRVFRQRRAERRCRQLAFRQRRAERPTNITIFFRHPAPRASPSCVAACGHDASCLPCDRVARDGVAFHNVSRDGVAPNPCCPGSQITVVITPSSSCAAPSPAAFPYLETG